MRIINLASGSDGNITYIENDGFKILVDDGLSCQESCKRLNLLGVKGDEIDAIIVSHSHSDHIKGIDTFSQKYNVPVYAHTEVWQSLDYKLSRVALSNRRLFDGKFEIGGLTVMPVEIPHDVKCFGFSFEKDSKKISILTDLGHTNDRILESISKSQLVYLEANYDRQMLIKGTKYPLALKRRIDGPNGHLSNDDSADAIAKLVEGGTKQIVLSHLSKENNRPELAYEYICQALAVRNIEEGVDVRIDVASPNPGVIFNLK